MTKRPAIVGLAAIAIVLALVRWASERGGVSMRDGTSARHAPLGPTDATVDSKSNNADSGAVEGSFATPVDSRRAPASFTLRAVDPDGMPIAGAEISWAILRNIEPSWPWPEYAHFAAPADKTMLSDENGVWQALPSLTYGLQECVVWVTHEGHAPRHFVLGPGESLASLPEPIQLERAPGVNVFVVDSEGLPVAGAEVHQRFELAIEDRAALSASQVAVRVGLWRSRLTDADGRARLSSLPGRQAIDARRHDLVTTLWRGSSPATVRLALVESVLCVGRVRPESQSLDVKGTAVRAFAYVGGTAMRVGATTVRSDGSIVPMRVARLDAEHYDLQLSGGRVVPSTHRRPAPAPGEVIQLDLVAREGTTFPVRVVDSSGSAIPGAVVGWSWPAGPIWEWWRDSTDQDGLCSAACIPVGSIWLEASKAGYLTKGAELQYVGEFSPAHPVTLERGGIVRGRVTAAGKPVEEFRIVVKPAADTTQERLREHTIIDARNGAFELDGVPLGDISLFAFAPDYVRTATVTAQVSVGQPAIVDFELPVAAEVKGVVLDAQTNEPIVGAGVQCWVHADIARLRPWGPITTTDRAGRFSLRAAPPDAACIVEVRAVGYASHHARAEARQGASVDFGTLLLSPPTSLEVQIDGDDRTPPQTIHGKLAGTHVVARRPATEAGRLTFEDVVVEDQTLTLDAGSDWGLDIPLRLGASRRHYLRTSVRRVRELAVRVRVESGGTLPPQSILRAIYWCRTAERPVYWASPVLDSQPIDIGYLDAAYFALDLVDAEGRSLGSALVAEPDRESPIFILTTGGEDRRLRIVDRRREPLVGASVYVARFPGGPERGRQSDEAGLVEFECFSQERANVFIYAPNVGSVLYRDLLLHQDPTEVLVDARARVRLILRDGDQAVGGVTVTILDGHGHGYLFERAATSANGEYAGFPVAAGRYEVVIDHPGIWPVRQGIDVLDDQRVHTIPIRRLGGVDLTVRAAGSALPGCAVLVESEEHDTSVGVWSSQGRCSQRPADGRTDANGRLSFDGLPHGAYRWSISELDGDVVTGRFTVEPSRRIAVNVELP